jgi:hypothetical protein
MPYKVVFVKGLHAVGVASIERAIAYAKFHFPFQQQKAGATSVYVIDIMNVEVLFRYPVRNESKDSDRPAHAKVAARSLSWGCRDG